MAVEKKTRFGAKDLRGIIAPMTTPFTRKGEVDEAASASKCNS